MILIATFLSYSVFVQRKNGNEIFEKPIHEINFLIVTENQESFLAEGGKFSCSLIIEPGKIYLCGI
jgi:hypothetical protein